MTDRPPHRTLHDSLPTHTFRLEGESAASAGDDTTDALSERPGSRRRRVLLLCGGQSPEHAVSLSSGRCCVHSLDRARWDVRVACVLQNGFWAFPRADVSGAAIPTHIDKLFDVLEYPDFAPRGYLNLHSVGRAIERLMGEERPEVILPVTHGPRGEDGVLQGLLDFLGIPYVGSGVAGSALAMDKARAQELVEAHGVRVARSVVVGPGRIGWNPERVGAVVDEWLGWPVFVKPSRGGSSLGTSIASNPAQLAECVELAARYDDTIVIQERVVGREVTCGVIEIAGCGCGAEDAGEGTWQSEEGRAGRIHRIVCPPTEIRLKSGDFFNYHSKYSEGACEEITPAPLDNETTRLVQETAERAHTVLGCRGLSRTDMIITREGEVVFLETNTLPGMTPTSLLPQAARVIGLDMTRMLSVMLDTCLATSRVARAEEVRAAAAG